MLGKLIKYEFKATARTFLPMFGALIVVSLINRLFDSLGMRTPRGIGIALSVILMIAIFVAALLITLQRFNKTLLQNEGYLTLTLPVKTESLIISKLLVSSVWQAASTIVVTIAILLLPVLGIRWSDIVEFIRTVFAYVTADAALIAVETVVAVIISLFASTLLIYACLALGMLVNSRRGLVSFAMFLVISTVVQTIGAVVVAIGYALGLGELFRDWSGVQLIHFTMLTTIVTSLAMCVVFFWITRHMLKNRLNLQ